MHLLLSENSTSQTAVSVHASRLQVMPYTGAESSHVQVDKYLKSLAPITNAWDAWDVETVQLVIK